VDTGEIVELPPSSVSPVSITIDKGLTAGRDHHVRITKIVTATISNPSVIQTYSNEIVLKINMKPIPAIGEISSDDIVTTQQSRLQSVCANGIPKLYSISGGLGMTYYWNTDIKNSVFTNKYGTPSIDTLKDSIYVSWPKTAADHYLIVFGETAGCVTPSKSLAIHVNNLPVVSLEGDVNLCQGQETTFTIHGDFKSIRWANQAIDSTYTTNKNDTVVVVVTDPKNCIGTDTAIVKVIPLPVVYLGKDTMLCGEHTLLLDAGNSGAKYLWSTGENNQTITIGKLAGGKLISVKVTVNDQPYNIECSNSDSIRIITCNILFTKDSIPTAFTPNGDGENDTWRIPGIADHAKAVVEVYDRWGRIVFHSLPGYIKEWNGRDDGGNFVPMDNYYYIINLNEKNAAPVVGSITIIR
jgi:gliding motility-associated-like protein